MSDQLDIENPYAMRARARRAAIFADAIRRLPLFIEAPTIPELESYSDEWWHDLATTIGIAAPSEVTKAMVLGLLDSPGLAGLKMPGHGAGPRQGTTRLRRGMGEGMTDIGKTEWGPGPWQDEPDRVFWRHSPSGFPCLAKRGPSGSWCGYVAVPPGHPAHEATYDGLEVEVHGGLTYAEHCDGNEGTGICHVPAEGEPDNVWWLGFDCAHYNDFSPGTAALMRSLGSHSPLLDGGTYRDLAYVRVEIERLACRLAEVAK